MAWIKATHDLPDKAEVVAMATKLGIDQDSVVGKLLRVWIWFDRETTNGVTSGVTPTVTDRIAFCPGFGRAMEAVGWIVFHDDSSASLPNFDDHNSETAKERAVTAKRVAKHRRLQLDGVTETVTQTVTSIVTSETESESEVLNSVKRSEQSKALIGKTPPAGGSSDLEEIRSGELEHGAQLAGALFKRSGYSGDDGGLLWQIAVLVKRGAVVESWAHSACDGARLNANRNSLGFVRKALTETAQKNGRDLPAMLRQAKLPKGCHKGPPKVVANDSVADLAKALSRKDST